MSSVSTATQNISAQTLALLNGSGSSTGTGNSNSTTAAATAASAAASGGTASGGVPSGTALQNEFLQLLTTQLQNQDPLSPMDSTSMTAQLAQISTVSGIQQLNGTMQQMMSSNTALETAQTANLIGHTVLGPGSSVALPASGGATLGVSLGGAASKVTATVVDGSGATVKTFDLGAEPSGVSTFNWDGTTDTGANAPTGNYTLKITASLDGSTVTASPLVAGKVTGVTSSASGVSLDVQGLGTVALGAVAQID